MTSSAYDVSGMTCGHCVSAVRAELALLDGVQAVDIVLETGRVIVASDHPLDPTAVAAAVEEAGYQLV